MKEMTLEDVQRVSIDILKEIDLFCKRNKIRYSVGYGALIGAVRHNGCIPWDDDIDIIMPRPDYEKFIKTYLSETGQFKVFAPELGNNFYAISRICDMQRTRTWKYYQWTDEITGVWVDIFPLDAIPPDSGFEIRAILNNCFSACRKKRPLSSVYGLKNAKILLQRILFMRLSRQREIEKYNSAISQLNYNSSERICSLGSPYRSKDIHDKRLFESYTRIPFADTEVCAIEHYDEYLRSIYGDYMKLPPPDQRKAGHTSNRYFWI